MGLEVSVGGVMGGAMERSESGTVEVKDKNNKQNVDKHSVSPPYCRRSSLSMY
jgi:hypothetical protein